MSLHFGKVLEKSNGRIKSYKAKRVVLDDSGLFGGIFLPLLGPWGRTEDFSQNFFYNAKLHMKIHFVAKFQENLTDGSPAISRTDGRTHGRTDARTRLITIVPFRLKSAD